MLTFVGVALGINASSAGLPTSTLAVEHQALGQRGPQCQQTPEVDQGLCLHIAAFGGSICRLQLDDRGSKHDPQSKQVGGHLLGGYRNACVSAHN